MKKIDVIGILFFLVFSLSSQVFFARSANEIKSFHYKVLSSFADLQRQNKTTDKAALQNLFKTAHEAVVDFAWKCDYKKLSRSGYLTLLNRDIASLKKIVKRKRKNKESIDEEVNLSCSLSQLQKFLKKYRLQIEVVGYHAALRAEWGDLFDLVDKGQDLLPALPGKGIHETGLKGLKVLVKKMERLLGDIDLYEDRLHADWVDLKLANYVCKIELIRLRNAAIFHRLYRGTPIQTSYPR